MKIQEMERTGRLVRMENGDLEWRDRSGEDKWRLKVEINSFVNGTELLHSEKTQSASKILRGESRCRP